MRTFDVLVGIAEGDRERCAKPSLRIGLLAARRRVNRKYIRAQRDVIYFDTAVRVKIFTFQIDSHDGGSGHSPRSRWLNSLCQGSHRECLDDGSKLAHQFAPGIAGPTYPHQIKE